MGERWVRPTNSPEPGSPKRPPRAGKPLSVKPKNRQPSARRRTTIFFFCTRCCALGVPLGPRLRPQYCPYPASCRVEMEGRGESCGYILLNLRQSVTYGCGRAYNTSNHAQGVRAEGPRPRIAECGDFLSRKGSHDVGVGLPEMG